MAGNPRGAGGEMGPGPSLAGQSQDAISHLPSTVPVEKPTVHVGEFDAGLVPGAYLALEKCMNQSQNPEIFRAAMRQLLADLVHSIDLKFQGAPAGAGT